MPDPVPGVDTSVYQHPAGKEIDWDAVFRSGVKVAVLKVGERQCKDPWFERDYIAASSAAERYSGPGARPEVTGYYFGHPADRATDDAAWFLFATRTKQFGMPPVLDLEVTDGVSEDVVRAYGHTWCDTVAAQTPTQADELYTFRSFLGALGTSFGRPVWIAWPGANGIPAGDAGVQNDQQGSVPGIDAAVDKDLFNITPEEAMAKFGLTSIAFVPASLENTQESDYEGRLPFYGTRPDGALFAFNGAAPIVGLNGRNIVREDVVGIAVLPDGSGVVLACDDGHEDDKDSDHWAASTYLLRP